MTALLLTLVLAQIQPGFPIYSASSIAHTAVNESGSYAPNTFISIYGVNLAAGTHAIGPANVQSGNLPVTLGGVRVLLNGTLANVYFASPRQVNVLIPTNFLPGPVNLSVVTDGRAGPQVRIDLEESAPGMFEDAEKFVIATHGNGPAITGDDPAEGGEVVVIYATGLGATSPMTPANRVPASAAPLQKLAEFEVRLNGIAVPRGRILYAGVTPGFAGLFQINLQLPENTPANPEIRAGTPEKMSPPGRFLRVR